jgi:ADP-ribose pyrophosphatase
MGRPPQVLKREQIFSGRKVALEVHRVRDADGRETTREVVLHGGSVAILAFPEPGRVLLEKNWRYALGREVLELPAGTLDADEAPRACAARELAEETGWRAGRLESLLVIHPSPGILSERLEIFLADDLAPGKPEREAGEQIENVLVPLDEAYQMIRDGRITDSKTVAGLLYWRTFRAGPGGGGDF